MISASMSAIRKAVLSPLRQVLLDKLVNHLVDYLSKDKPSSSSSRDAENHQQMLSDLRDLQRIMNKIKGTLRVAKKLHKKDESVADLLRELKEVVYEAQDLMDDLEYEKLRRKVEELNRSQAESSANRSASKRPRLSASDDQTLLELSPDEDFMIKLRKVIGEANRIHSDMKHAIKMATVCLTLDMQQESSHRGEFVTKRFTTSSVNESKIYGRDHERERLAKVLKDSSKDGGIAVFPIIGMGGIGKTTLAQCLFNNGDLANQFDVRTWICVSDKFDRLRITREMVESLSAYRGQQFPHNRNLDLLEREIKQNLSGKRLLLVLDDVWSCEWTQLLVTLESSKPACVTIILTTRDPTVLQGKGKGRETCLKGMGENDYWLLFVSFAFGDEDPHKHPELENIARRIVCKLKTSPLAAKTVGRLLYGNLSEEHWTYVLKSDLWKLETSDPNDIMPILALSYDHLPEHLQICFGFCSMFPKDYQFQVAELVEMWIAHGYVVEKTETSSLTAEEIGQKYFDELLSRSFFECYRYTSDYTIHDLLHDLAQSVSLGEYYVFEDEAENKIPPTVRHLCVRSPLDLRSVCSSKNLRTLFIDKVELPSLELEALKSTRVLVLSDYNLRGFPDAICHMKHLRYLNLLETSIESTPEPLCELYHLRVLGLPDVNTLPDSFHNLINLRYFKVEPGYGDLLYRQEFPARNKNGYMTAQLRNMKELRGNLVVKNLENIKSKEEASKLNMKEKSHLKELELEWYPGANYTPDDAEKALEGLQPHPKLQVLHVDGYTGSRIPSWFRDLQDLREIYLYFEGNCTTSISPIGLLPSLRSLTLRNINAEVEASDGTIVMFPALLKLCLVEARLSFHGISSSTTREEFSLFPRLSVLYFDRCHQVSGLPLPWLIHPPLEYLQISDSPVLDDQLPECLRGLTSLTEFRIWGSNLTRLPEQVAMTALTSLRSLEIEACNQLYSVGGLQSLSSLGSLDISWCPKLTSWSIDETEQGSLLLPELRTVSIQHCASLSCLPAWLSCIPSLGCLLVKNCPNIHSLPEAGFPLSLSELVLVRCHPDLIARCKEEGSREWSMIQRIPDRTVSD